MGRQAVWWNRRSFDRKLAEWVGFKEQGTGYWYPLTREFGKQPNFTQSLDACFEWLVPKLDNFQRALIIERWAIKIMLDKNAEPALALCLAIEKLIDEEDEESLTEV